MRRIIDYHLINWKTRAGRKPLILRGARQVGKTHAVRRFGKSFTSFVEVNLEALIEAQNIFELNLDPQRIIRDLSLLLKQSIIPGETLLFIDEIQEFPRAIIALRYFYEEMPELHVIAAGSLLDFAIEKVGVPVGRVSFQDMYPMSFIEYLVAMDNSLLAKAIITDLSQISAEVIHDKALRLLGEYCAVGGMPAAVQMWRDSQDLTSVMQIQQEIIDGYLQDIPKYATQAQVKYVELIFKSIPAMVSERFQTSKVSGEYRKRELVPAIDLLEKAQIAHRVYHTNAHGKPLDAQVDYDCYKLIFLDVALGQRILGSDQSDWILNPKTACINKVPVIKALIGQELLTYNNDLLSRNLYYWQRQRRSSSAKVDYVAIIDGRIVPIDVKRDPGTTLKSMRLFLESYPEARNGIRFSTHQYSDYDKIITIPLYAVANIIGHSNALENLFD